MMLDSERSSHPSSLKPLTAKSSERTVSQTLKDPTAQSTPVNAMRAVRLSERIRYIHCEGGHGVMTFCSAGGAPLFVKEVETQEDFRLNYSVFRMMEDLV